MKRKGLFRSVVAMVIAVTLVCTELPVMPQPVTKGFAMDEDGGNTAPETGVDLAAKYAPYITPDYPYVNNYRSGLDEIVLSSSDSQRGDIILEWPGVAEAAYYDVFRNGTWITSIAADSQMSYDDGAVEGSTTYKYVVFARNNNEEIVGTSNVYTSVTKDAMTVSSRITLDSDMNVFSLDIISGGLDLNGHTLTVCRDITITNSYSLNIGKGKLYCYGNINVGNENYSGYINLSDSNDYLYVAGNIDCKQGRLYFYDGTVEIGGNLTIDTYASMSCTVPNSVIFSGFDAQYVIMPKSTSFADIELRNYSVAGVTFAEAYNYSSIKANNTVLKIAEEDAEFLNLTEDTTIEGDYELNGGMILLNGHQLTVTGNVIHKNGIIDADEGVLNINGDYLQESGMIYVNGGTVNIGGDYRMQHRTGNEENYVYGPCEAYLYMTSDEDRLNVAGSFYCASPCMSARLLVAGRLSIGRDFEFYTSRGAFNFETYDSHTVVLNGNGSQTVKTDYLISYGSYVKFANIEIENVTDGNVVFNEIDNILIKGSFNDNGHAFGGRIQLGNSDSVIVNGVLNGSLMSSYTSLNCYNPTEIKGNLYLRTSCYIYNDCTVDGNIYIGEQYKYNSYSGDEIYEYSTYSSGYMYVYGPKYYSGYNGKLYVKGSVFCDEKSYQGFYNYGGTVSVEGDLLLNDSSYFTDSYKEDSKFIFCGTQKQTIHVPINMTLGNIIILNESTEGVVATSEFEYESIEKNGNNFTCNFEKGSIGWTLSEDEVIEGDLVLEAGKLDLNGHKLEITGNLIQPAGTVFVNGGKLYIGGDYRIQSVSETEATDGDKKTEYGVSTGVLVMKDENDEVHINGGFYSLSSISTSNGELTAGVMDVKGDFKIDGNYNSRVFCPKESHKVVFSGAGRQNVKIENCYCYSYFNNVEITNSVNGNLSFGTEDNSVVFVGEFNDNGHSISGYIQPSGAASFKNGTFNGSIYITHDSSMNGTYHITGDVIISSSITLNGTMTVDGDVVFKNSGYLTFGAIGSDESYLEVKGDISAVEDCSSCRIYFSHGSLKLHGNLDLPCCSVSTYMNNTTGFDTNRFILCGTEKQTVEVDSGSSFGQIIIENTSEDGVYSHDKFDALYVRDDNNKLHYGTYAGNEETEGRFGWTLQKDETIEKDLILYDKILDLNGHTLTVKGDLIQAGGLITINKGTLVVTGDYRVQTRTTTGYGFTYTASTGSLKMINAEDTVEISGNYYNQSTKGGEGLLTAGKMYVGGDFNLKTESVSVFQPSGTHTVILNVGKYTDKVSEYYRRSGCHRVSTVSSFAFCNLEIETDNTVYLYSSGIGAKGKVTDNGTIVSGTLYIYPDTTFTNNIYHGDVRTNGYGEYNSSYEITGSMTVGSTVYFKGNLTVDGNVYLNQYTSLYLNGEESVFTVKGFVQLDYEADLYLNNKTSNFHGNTSIYSWSRYTGVYFNCETVNCYGDLIVNYDRDTISIKDGTLFNFCGSMAQNVTLNSNYKFSDIVINNTSSDGVAFNRTVFYDSLTTNGHRVRFGGKTLNAGWTLTGNEEIEGELCLGEGELDLAGYNLTIKGDFYQTDGKVILNGGTLTVEGDYYISGIDSTGKPSGMSRGTLVMTDSSEHLLVKGNVIINQNLTDGVQNILTAGVFEMKGDCSVNNNTLEGTGAFKVVFSGSSERTVTGSVRVPYLENRCTADEGGNIGDLLMNGNLYVSEKVTDAGQNIKGSGYLYINDFSVIENGSYSGNVYLNYTSEYDKDSGEWIYSECTMTRDITIGGSLTAYSNLKLAEYCLKVGTLYAAYPIYVQKGKIICDGDLSMGSSGFLEMTEEEASISVKGNFSTYYYSGSQTTGVNFTAGTFELQGNFTDTATPSAFNSSGTNTVILSGKTVNGSDFIQSIKISDTKAKFNKLVLKKQDTAYKFSRSVSKMAKEVIRDVDTSGRPSNISGLSVVSYTESSVKLSYSEATDDKGVTGYRIYRNGLVCGTTKALTFTDTGLQPNTVYTYTVLAIDAENNISEASPSVTVTTKADNSRPEPVKTMSVSRRTGSSVTLTWKAAIDNVGIKEYEVYRKDGSGDFKLIAEHVKKTTYKDEGITAGIQYRYYLVAIDTSGNRSEKGIETDASAAVPQISYVSPSDKEKIGGDKIEFTVIYNNWGKSQNNTVMLEYEDSNNAWQPIVSSPLNQMVYKNSTNYLYSTYTWYFGDADFNDSVRFRITLTDEDNNTAEKIISCIIDRTAPNAPEEFNAADNGGTVKLTWSTSSSDDCKGYTIYRSTSAGQGYSEIYSIEGRNILSYTDTSVKKDVKYYYAIEAYDDFGNISEKVESGEIVVENDRQPPVVKSINPDKSFGPDKSVIGNGKVTIVVKAEDNKAVKSVVLSIRGENESSWTALTEVLCTEGTALYNLNTAAYDDGVYYLRAVARDEEGNVSEEYKKRFSFDNTGISKTTLTGSAISSTVVNLVWANELIESDFDYYSVEKFVRMEGGEPVYTRIAKVSDNYNYYVSDLLPGEEQTYIVVGYDIYGNRGIESDPVTVSTFEDTTGPTIMLVENAGLPYSDIIPLSVRARDNLALAYAVFSYSLDGVTYKEITRVDVSSPGAKEDTFIYNWDISAFPEGKVYVLFEVYDTSGHRNSLKIDGKDITAEYIIDRTAPAKVTGLTLNKSSGSVEFSWDEPKADAEEDKVVGFVVMRADATNGIFKKLADGYRLSYTDNTVSIGKEYIYKVAALDYAGNQGEFSDALRVSVYEDNMAPEIVWIYSPYGDVLPINPEIRIAATDNRNLAKLYVDYSSAASDTETWISLYEGSISGMEEEKNITWNTDGLTEGNYAVRAYATDENENAGEYKTAEFTLDLTAPEKPAIKVENGNMYIDIEIEGTEPEDFSEYEIYRREAGGAEKKSIYRGKEKTYHDKNVEALTVYVYQAVIYDKHGNAAWSDEMEGTASDIDDAAPEAVLTSDNITGVEGDEITLYGGNSKDNVGITAYKWYLDNEYIGDGIQLVHKFTEVKTYSLKLEVYDRAGNVGTAEGKVVIYEKATTGTFVITVTNEEGKPIAGATINIKEPDGSSSNVRLDNNASTSFSREPGSYQVAAYINGFLPNEITVSINAQEKKEYVICLQQQEILESSMGVRKLSYAEYAKYGVDPDNPVNKNTVLVSFDVVIDGQKRHISTPASPKQPGVVSLPGGSSSGSDQTQREFYVTLPHKDSDPIIIYYESRPAVSWLKNMYEVYLSIVNHASAEYCVEDLTATLTLPQYISFAALTGREQTEKIELGTLYGQESCSASWIITGSRSGNYDFNVDINGRVMPFEEPYSVPATSSAYIDAAYGGNLHLFIVVDQKEAYHDTDFVNYVLINEGKKDYNGVSIVLSDESVEYNGEERDINVNQNKVTIGTLKPWTPLYLRSSMSDSVGTAYRESNLDYHINYLRGKNLGMEISVVEALPDLYHKEGEVKTAYGNLKWEVKYGILTVEGEGDYADPSLAPSVVKAPWHDGETEKHIGKAEIDVKNMTLTTAMFEDCTKLKSFTFKNSTDKVKNMRRMFRNCTSLTTVKMEKLKSSVVTDISYMFFGCTGLSIFDGSDFQTKTVTNISGAFKSCSSLRSLDLSTWDLSAVDNVDSFLADCKALIRIESPKVTPKNVDISLKECKQGAVWELQNGSTSEEVHSIAKNKRKSQTYLRTGGYTPEYDIKFKYASSDVKDVTYNYRIDFRKFFTSSYEYQHDLLQASLRTAMAAFDRDLIDPQARDKNIRDLMNDLDFEDIVTVYPKPEYDTIGYAIANRDIFSDDGEEATLILVAIRGKGYGEEWGGNFEVGTKTEHQGFNTAAETVIYGEDNEVGLKDYIKNNRSKFKDKIKIWVVGYSRAGATTNLVCAKIIDGKAGFYDVASKDVFGFSFECPRTTTSSDAHAERYNGLKCVVNPIDFVPMVPMNNGANWNFERYGITYTTGALDSSNYYTLKTNMVAQYRKILTAQGFSNVNEEVDKRLDTYSGQYYTQEEFCSSVFKNLADNTVDRQTYVNNLETRLKEVVGNLMPLLDIQYASDKSDFIEDHLVNAGIVVKSASKTNPTELGYFKGTGFAELLINILPILKAHQSEQCLAWVDSTTKFGLYYPPKSSSYYLAYYDDNGGTGAPNPIKNGNQGGKITISTTEPSREGYLFAGWTINPLNSLMLISQDSDYYPGSELQISDYGKTLYARWVKDDDYYRLSLHNFDKSYGITKYVFVKKGKKYELPKSKITELNRYKSWYTTSPSGRITYSPGDKITPSGNMDIYATWDNFERKYVQIHYDLNYAGCNNDIVDSVLCNDDTSFRVSYVMPKRKGYVFCGWSLNQRDAANGDAGVMPGENVYLTFEEQTLYAGWTEVSSAYVRERLQEMFGKEKFPNELFWEVQDPLWIDIPEKNAFVCLKTEEMNYDPEGKQKNYDTDAFAFYVSEKGKVCVKHFDGYEMEFSPFDTVYNIACVEASTLPGEWAKRALIALCVGKKVVECSVNHIMGANIVGISKKAEKALKAYKCACDIISSLFSKDPKESYDLASEVGYQAFFDKYKDVLEAKTIEAIFKFVGKKTKKYFSKGLKEIAKESQILSNVIDFISIGEIIDLLLEIEAIVETDAEYDRMDIAGDSNFAVASMMNLMREAGFNEEMVKQVPEKVGVIFESAPTVTVPDINQNVTKAGVNCPVDIKVYDSTGSLVGYIRDNVPQAIEGGVKTEVDENEQKLVYMEGKEQYRLEIIATDDGEVSFFTQTYNMYTEEVFNVQTYSDMKVKKGDTIRVDIMPVVKHEIAEEGDCFAETPVRLCINDGKEVKATKVQKGKGIVYYHVTAKPSSAAAGAVTGGGSFLNGEFCKVTAKAKTGYEFEGWEENGELVSSDAEYRFEVNSDHSISAKFVKKNAKDGKKDEKKDDKKGGTTRKFTVKVGAIYTDENGVRYEITAVRGKKKATESTVKYLGPKSKKVKKIVIPDTVTINGKAFTVTALDTGWTKGNRKLETVVLNGKIKKLPAYTFKGCTALKKVTLGANVTVVGTGAFYKCTALKTVKLSASLKKLGNKAFYGCSSLKNIVIPSKVTSIGSYAFYKCRKLEKVTIKTKLLKAGKIGSKAFAGIASGAVVKVPKTK